jgi:hypothetical protein
MNTVILLWVPPKGRQFVYKFQKDYMWVCHSVMVAVLLQELGRAITVRNCLVSYVKSED